MSELKVNTISEVTGANGVTVDGLSIKDSKLVTANSVIEANMSANSVDSDSYVDGSIYESYYGIAINRPDKKCPLHMA